MEICREPGCPGPDMLKRVAFFRDLKGSDGGLPYGSTNVVVSAPLQRHLIFRAAKGRCGAITSPVGDGSHVFAAIKISEGFNLGYCRAKPGNGPMMHNHDTNETFIPMTGTWRCSWENEKGDIEFVDAGPLDVVSFPPGVARRFENVTPGDPNEESILMFVIGGDGLNKGVHRG